MKQSSAYYILLVGTMLWCGLLFLPPIAMQTGYPKLSIAAYITFSSICHQLDSHSLHFMGNKLAVCARCSMVYFGFLFGVIASGLRFRRINFDEKIWLGVAVIPMLLDVGCDLTGIHHATLLTRIITGSFFGIIAGYSLTPMFQTGFPEFISLTLKTTKSYVSETR